ncbi:hypothetical protein [Frigoriflavimonas asaccharolytica]|uniref:Uncharacterized protein n=1 Tax=Frigoriflavimonas asaccharolytica TaxID=2735899 RepID=A0A8J8K9X2_9FLAO|nr:hypothetical protein [Frigoriflavimonas asaccharolytica]NRS94111.1 hypothetical protein [Frigoriflavimonas asaccharolytica]
MKIRYTSINDVYGNYIFNFEDNITGIKNINDFAVENIKSSKKVSDSVNTLFSKMSKEEAQDYASNQSLPTMATNVIFYKALDDLDGQPDQKDILIEYILDENTFGIKNINISNNEHEKDIVFKERIKSKESLSLEINLKNISSSDLKIILEKVDQIALQKKVENFQYKIEDEKENLLFCIEFQKMGEYISLKFPSKS